MIKSLRIMKLKLYNCNCFDEMQIDFESDYSLICGTNGIGKTTILNAIGASFSNSYGVPLD